MVRWRHRQADQNTNRLFHRRVPKAFSKANTCPAAIIFANVVQLSDAVLSKHVSHVSYRRSSAYRNRHMTMAPRLGSSRALKKETVQRVCKRQGDSYRLCTYCKQLICSTLSWAISVINHGILLDQEHLRMGLDTKTEHGLTQGVSAR